MIDINKYAALLVDLGLAIDTPSEHVLVADVLTKRLGCWEEGVPNNKSIGMKLALTHLDELFNTGLGASNVFGLQSVTIGDESYTFDNGNSQNAFLGLTTSGQMLLLLIDNIPRPRIAAWVPYNG